MKIVVVCGICVERDAISAAAAGQAELLAGLDGVDEVTLVAQAVGRVCGVRAIVASNAWDFLRLDEVRDADVIIYHWGIRYELFESLPLVAGSKRTIVHFHNLTPVELVPPEIRDVIEYSALQFQLAALADAELWSVSRHNHDRLAEWGFDPTQVQLIPFVIERPAGAGQGHRAADRADYVCVGRFVPSKGVHDLVEAMAIAEPALRGRTSLTLVGDAVLSSMDYAEDIFAAIERHSLGDVVRIRNSVDDTELWRLYDRSHVVVSPSYHEGLCVPIVEGYAAGCRAIGTDAGNLPYIVQPPDPVVAAGDPAALAAAMISVGESILAGTSAVPEGAATVVSNHSSARVSASLERALGLRPDEPRR